MRLLAFQLRYPNGQTEQINVEHERALIGSGAHCDIRLPLEQSAAEHVLIEVGAGNNVFARALHFEPPPLMNNIPFTQAPLPPDSVLGVGQVQIMVQAQDVVGNALAQQEKKKTSPLVIVMVLLIGAVWVWIFLSDPPTEAATPKAPKHVELWGPTVTTCPQTGEQALAVARERRIVADAKRERRPFHVQDGVAAVPIYELAGACFKAGGDIDSSNQAYAAANALRSELDLDYKTQRVRLEHALVVNDQPTAQREVKILLAFTEGKPGDYVTWLSNLDRKLKVKLGSGGKK